MKFLPILNSSIKQAIYKELQSFGFILLAILSASFGLKGFLLPNRFLDGGITGISLLIHFLTGFNLPLLIFVLNIPFLAMGFWLVSRGFALRTIIAIAGLDLCLLFIRFPVITADKLLIAVFGGFFLGSGIGLAIRGGAVIDGTEVMALFISRKTRLMVGRIILLFNILIFAVAAALLNVETGMYAILTYFAAARTVDFIVHGIEEYTGVYILSQHSDVIRKRILKDLGRGVTIFQGKRGLHDTPQDILFLAITRLEIPRLMTEVTQIDPAAFIIQHSINDLKGGYLKRKHLAT